MGLRTYDAEALLLLNVGQVVSCAHQTMPHLNLNTFSHGTLALASAQASPEQHGTLPISESRDSVLKMECAFASNPQCCISLQNFPRSAIVRAGVKLPSKPGAQAHRIGICSAGRWGCGAAGGWGWA